MGSGGSNGGGLPGLGPGPALGWPAQNCPPGTVHVASCTEDPQQKQLEGSVGFIWIHTFPWARGRVGVRCRPTLSLCAASQLCVCVCVGGSLAGSAMALAVVPGQACEDVGRVLRGAWGHSQDRPGHPGLRWSRRGYGTGQAVCVSTLQGTDGRLKCVWGGAGGGGACQDMVGRGYCLGEGRQEAGGSSCR